MQYAYVTLIEPPWFDPAFMQHDNYALSVLCIETKYTLPDSKISTLQIKPCIYDVTLARSVLKLLCMVLGDHLKA